METTPKTCSQIPYTGPLCQIDRQPGADHHQRDLIGVLKTRFPGTIRIHEQNPLELTQR